MSTSSVSNTVSKVRTFAGDLNVARSKKTEAPITPSPITTVVTEKSLADNRASEQIVPPFHSFNHSNNESLNTIAAKPKKEVSTSQSETQKIITENSKLSVSTGIKESLPAVIITDTKHKRFKLSEAIFSSLGNWWGTKKDQAKKNKTPRYTVPEAERRKGVIQKATAKTGRTAAADHSAVINRIKATKQIPHEPALALGLAVAAVNQTPQPDSISGKVIIQNPQVTLRQNSPRVMAVEPKVITSSSKVSWESDSDVPTNILPEPTSPSNIVTSEGELSRIKLERNEVTPKKEVPQTHSLSTSAPVISTTGKTAVSLIHPVIPTPTLIPPVAPVVPVAVRPVPVVPPIALPLPTPITPTPASRSKITPTIPVPVVSKPFPAVAVPPTARFDTPLVTKEDGENVSAPTERRFAPPREEKSSIFTTLLQTNYIVFIAFGVLIFVVVSGLGLRAYLASPQTDTPVTQDTTTNTVFSETSIRNNTKLVTTPVDLTTALAAEKSVSDSLIEITFLNQSGELLSPSDLLAVLGADILFDFKLTLTDVAIGTYRESPWIAFTVSDKNTAFGGMLDWENNLYRDLAPILASGMAESRNRFTDDIIGTTDVRTLKNEDGTEALVYGFINGNTLLITTNSTVFLNLAGKIN